jgi:hypothetical protein
LILCRSLASPYGWNSPVSTGVVRPLLMMGAGLKANSAAIIIGIIIKNKK